MYAQMTLQPVDGDTECYQRDPRIPSVECINYNLSLSDYTHTNLAPSSGELLGMYTHKHTHTHTIDDCA